MTALLIKVTLLYLAGLIALMTARRSTAAMRHLLCVCTMAGSLILPLAALLPTRALTFRFASINAAVAGSRAITRSTAWPSSRALFLLWGLGSLLLLLRI